MCAWGGGGGLRACVWCVWCGRAQKPVPLNSESMHHGGDGQWSTGRGGFAEVSHSSSLHLLFENETVRQAACRDTQQSDLPTDTYGSHNVFHVPLLAPLA